MRVNFLVIDPSAQYETGDVVTWTNKLVLRSVLGESGGKRTLELRVAPQGHIRYTIDGSEPREGIAYDAPFEVGDGEVLVRGFAEANGLETHEDFKFGAVGKKGVRLDETKAGRLVSPRGRRLDSRGKTFEGLRQAAEKSITFENVTLTVGQGSQVASFMSGDIVINAAFIESILKTILEKFDTTTPVTMTFRKANFASGHDLRDFAEKLGIELQAGEIDQ